MAKPVGVYYLNQPSDTEPNYFIELKEARQLKARGEAFFINHGKAIRLLENTFLPKITEDKQHSGWKVLGQTPKNAIRPGFPVWQLCQ